MVLFLYLLFKLYLLKLFSYPIYPINHNLSPFLSSLCLLYSTPQLKCLQHFCFFFLLFQQNLPCCSCATAMDGGRISITYDQTRPFGSSPYHANRTYKSYLYLLIYIFASIVCGVIYELWFVVNHHVNVLVFF